MAPKANGDSFRLLPCIGSGPRRTFGDIVAITPDEPMPFAADIHNGKIAGAERRAFD